MQTELDQGRPLNADLVRTAAPLSPGIYRIRVSLTYIGQTGRTLRERLLALANGTHSEQCPFNDPHTAAPHLWLLSRLDGAQLEFSCTPVAGDRSALRGTEDMLLWRHRVENKCSTEANYWPLLSRLVAPDEPLGQARREQDKGTPNGAPAGKDRSCPATT